MIDKVGAIIINKNKMLVAREEGNDVFFIPGGTRERGESDEACLKREISEELGTNPEIEDFYGEFVTKTHDDKDHVKVRAYFCRLKGDPKPNGEVEELAWADSRFETDKLGNILKVVIPQLKREGRVA